MNCKECKENAYPENPEQPFYAGKGRYLKALCNRCPGYTEKTTEATPVIVTRALKPKPRMYPRVPF